MLRVPHLLIAIALVLVGCATNPDRVHPPSVASSQKEVFDILEAALRSQLAKVPLRHHSVIHVYIQNTEIAVSTFAQRFPEYQMIVKRDSAGNSPPHPRYEVRLGEIKQDDASVRINDGSGSVFYTLQRRGDRWIVVATERPIVT